MNVAFHILLLGAFLYIVAYLRRRRNILLPLPPGPPADPLIGHLRILPTSNEGLVYHEWSKKYGDVMHLRVLGRNIIILNSVKAANDLLDKRGALYSDRPKFTVFEMLGWVPDIAFLSYGERFRKQRKLFHTYFTQEECRRFRHIQLENAHLLVEGLLDNKGNHGFLIGRYSTSVVLRIAYGHRILSDDDEFLQLVNRLASVQKQTGPPGGTPIDLFPLLRHFPPWFPGTHYANFAREWRWLIRSLYDTPFERIKAQWAQGTAEPSFVASQLEASSNATLSEDGVDNIKGAAAVIYAAGADTTSASLNTYLLALLLHPEVQKKGQEEIDRVIGSERLPMFEDYDALPYVGCVTQEILRWYPATPLGIPHRSVKHDVYEGMFIPKGSIVFANTTGMSLNEDTYSNPTQFNPDRFMPRSLGGTGEPPFTAAFGFGRRLCVGRHLATANLWIVVATLFATLQISKARDEDGEEITPALEFESGISSHPKQFPCTVAARSEKARQLIASECEVILSER